MYIHVHWREKYDIILGLNAKACTVYLYMYKDTYVRFVEINLVGELQSNLVECTSGPVTKPVENTPVEQGRGGGSSVL